MSPKTHILVVEDEADIANLIKHSLERIPDFVVSVASSGDAAMRALTDDLPDLMVLDLNLPVISGTDICRRVRGSARTAQLPIIMLTAKTDEAERVAGLELGADDYVTKPFSIRELGARVRAVLRRRLQGETQTPIFKGAHLMADFDAVAVTVDGVPIRLTRREFELLQFLVENRNRVLSRDRLLQRVWGYDLGVETRSVDVHVGRLRAKLGVAGSQIETVVGLGYRFIE
jgi:DNA-binding response OmpR family regulator